MVKGPRAVETRESFRLERGLERELKRDLRRRESARA